MPMRCAPKALSTFVRSVLVTLATWHQTNLWLASLNRFDLTLLEYRRSDAPEYVYSHTESGL